MTGLKGRITVRQVFLTICIIACGMAISSALGYTSYQLPLPSGVKAFFDSMEQKYSSQTLRMVNLSNIFELIISVIILALLPAICEEALFRGGFQNYMYRSTGKMWLSVLTVSLIFSIVHFSGYGFLSRLMLGIVLGLIYQYSGRLWLSILAHFINNAAAVVVMYVQTQQGKPIEKILNDTQGNYLGYLWIPVIVFLFWRFRKLSLTNQTTNGI
ncbi:MAG: CPBP family intramembrane metalloprotease [Niabella sp.]